jgi:enoyl-CoA hydratase
MECDVMSSTLKAVRLERLPGHVALVTINRPDARNAVNAQVATDLEAAVDVAEADPDIRVVVLTGEGPDAFCAGADLKEVSAGQGHRLSTERGGFAGFVFRERTKPWIAAINGKALAGGAEIALACDLVVAGEHAAFGLPEVMRGLIAAAGGLFRLPRAIPRNVALELILTAGQLDAQRAFQLGLVNRLASKAGLLDEALALAAEIARNAPVAVRESLSIASRANELTEDELRELTRDAFARVMASDDFKEGPRAFIEKRAPRWTGR